jgi:hypothetical protein
MTAPGEVALLPCRMCGSAPRAGECRIEDDGYSFVECPATDHTCLVHADSPEEAAAVWNRTPAAVAPAVMEAMAIVNEQAEDERLWFLPKYITEDYLQRALRRLHAAIEGKSPEECAASALRAAAPETGGKDG